VLITGSPGGRTIINTVLCVILQTIDYKQPLRDAVAAPRLHMGWFPEQIQLEERPNLRELRQALEAFQHKTVTSKQGDAHSIAVDLKTDMRLGVADTRLDGHAVGERKQP
jgi:gamma-glutamyltranspeptidase/glutathione hydrolase